VNRDASSGLTQIQNAPPTPPAAVGLIWPAKFGGRFSSVEIRKLARALRRFRNSRAPRRN